MNYLFRAVLVMAFSIRTIVWQSVMILSNSVDSRYLASWSNSSQYSVSPASFNAIYILAIKSALLCANWASFIFAPMLVPLRSNCLLRTNSLLFETKWRYKHIIRKANDLLNDWTVDFSLHTSHLKLHIVYCGWTRARTWNGSWWEDLRTGCGLSPFFSFVYVVRSLAKQKRAVPILI